MTAADVTPVHWQLRRPFFTRGKVVTSRWLDPSHGGINPDFPQNV